MNFESTKKVSTETVSNIKSYNNLCREGFQREVRAFKLYGYHYPSLKSVCSFEKLITPTIMQLENGLGIELDYKEAIEISTTGNMAHALLL